MATIANVTTEVINTKQNGITLHCIWEELVTGSLDGDAFVNPNFKYICIQVTGTFNTATLTLQGTNDTGAAGTETWFTLTDGAGIAAGNNVVFTAAGAKHHDDNRHDNSLLQIQHPEPGRGRSTRRTHGGA